MTTFYIKQTKGGRVYLCPEEPTEDETVLRTLKAKDWKSARAKIMAESYRLPSTGEYYEH